MVMNHEADEMGVAKDASAYRGELVAGVADEHTCLAHGAVADRDALDEPRGTGRHGRARLSPILRAQRRGETGEERARRRSWRGGTECVLAFFGDLGWCWCVTSWRSE